MILVKMGSMLLQDELQEFERHPGSSGNVTELIGKMG